LRSGGFRYATRYADRRVGNPRLAWTRKCLDDKLIPRAWVAELAYAAVSKTAARKGMGVRLPPQAPWLKDLQAHAVSVARAGLSVLRFV
jgi:hypothetical protein